MLRLTTHPCVIQTVGAALCTVALLMPSGAAAQGGFTDADLTGRYAFGMESSGSGSTFALNGADRETASVGVLEFDGSGGVVGTRTLRRSIYVRDAGLGAWHLRFEEVAQELTGTYRVAGDGTGSLELTATPNPLWSPTSNIVPGIDFSDEPEAWRFSLTNARCRLRLMAELRGSWQMGTVDVTVQLAGSAERDDGTCGGAEPDPRVDALIELVERQSAQLCELIRLVHTPQGQRESAAPEVEDACGRSYAWSEKP